VDAGVSEGAEVPVHYDPLVAKLIVWGPDRAEAIRRMRRALGEFGVAGVRTTIPFHLAVTAHPDFAAGRLSTAFADGVLPALAEPAPPEVGRAAVVAALLHAYRGGRRDAAPAGAGAPGSAPPRPSRWAQASRPGGRTAGG
jgi:acetyl/propionyl-CoA carboxylase alpha subunit